MKATLREGDFHPSSFIPHPFFSSCTKVQPVRTNVQFSSAIELGTLHSVSNKLGRSYKPCQRRKHFHNFHSQQSHSSSRPFLVSRKRKQLPPSRQAPRPRSLSSTTCDERIAQNRYSLLQRKPTESSQRFRRRNSCRP